MLKTLLPNNQSDRLVLTVRMTSDGHREWLSSNGRIALVYWEGGSWRWRRNDRETARECDSEMGGLNNVLYEQLFNLRLASRRF